MLIFTLDELLSELGIVENTLRARIEKDGFPHPRKMGTGNKIFWNVSEVAEWLMRCPKAWGGEDCDIAESAAKVFSPQPPTERSFG